MLVPHSFHAVGCFLATTHNGTRENCCVSKIRLCLRSFMVRERGLEPPRPCGHYHLKVACIANFTTRAF